jgi:hypothetical protein
VTGVLVKSQPMQPSDFPIMSSLKPISQLLGLITEASATLTKTCTANGTDLPDLHAPFYAESEAFRQDPIAAEAANVVGLAALQLAALVMPPHLYMFNLIGGVSREVASVQ